MLGDDRQEAAEHHDGRVEDVDSVRQRGREDAALPLHLGAGVFSARLLEGGSQLGVVRVLEPDDREQPVPVDLVLEHPVRRALVGRHGDAWAVLPELPGVAAHPADRHPVDDEPATDAARAAIEIDDVVDADGRAVQVLRDRAQGRIVAHRGLQAGGLRDEVADGGIDPLQVGRIPHESVGGADQARDGNPHPDDVRLAELCGPPPDDLLGDELRRALRAEDGLLGQADAGVHVLVQSDRSELDRVDLGVGGDGHDGRPWHDQGRGPPHPA